MDHLSLRMAGIPGRIPDFNLERGKTAFMIIDMYYRSVDRRYGFGRRAKESGIEHELDYYYDRLDSTVVPNLVLMLEACRAHSIDVVHVKVGTHTFDGRDAGWRYKGWKLFDELKAEHEIIKPLQPIEGEIVLTKTTSSVFNSTTAELIFRNMGIQYLIIGGVVTGNCVETAVRDASDRDFKVYLLEDGCAGLTQDAQEFSVKYLHLNYAHAKTTESVIKEIESTWKTSEQSINA